MIWYILGYVIFSLLMYSFARNVIFSDKDRWTIGDMIAVLALCFTPFSIIVFLMVTATIGALFIEWVSETLEYITSRKCMAWLHKLSRF